MCGGMITNPKDPKGSKIKSTVDLSVQYTKFVDQPICSLYCPCPAAAAKTITATAQPQTALAAWGRYVDASSNADASYLSSGYPSSPPESSLALNFAKASDTQTATYNTYKDCYLKVLSANDDAKAPAT